MTEQARRIDGAQCARGLRERLRERLQRAGATVRLATVLVGDDAASGIYIARKRREAREVGIDARHAHFPADVAETELLAHVRARARDSQVHGILVQLPLPDHLDADRVLDAIPPGKDVDGLTTESLGRLVAGRAGLRPCTPLGVMELIRAHGIETRGARAVVVGRSRLVGLPLALMLAHRGVDATVTLAHARTRNLEALARAADILVAATGRAGLIGAAHIKPGACVFDVGVSRVDGAIAGDVRHDEAREVAGALTPMPGGTGPMTVACLLANTAQAAADQGVLV